MVDAQLFRDGTPVSLTHSGPIMVSNTTFNFLIESFEASDSGNYTCRAAVHSNSTFLNTSNGSLSNTLRATTGEQLTLTI